MFGYADAGDPRFALLREEIVPGHLLPSDLLAAARSVFCFFLPFAEEIVHANRKAEVCADEWAIAYLETNALISEICAELGRRLERVGVEAAWQQPTRNFDPETLKSSWSHKSVAVIAGLGTIGLHHMLITRMGCAGRVGSIVVGASLTPSVLETTGEHGSAPSHERPTEGDMPQQSTTGYARPGGYQEIGVCRWCADVCPASAIPDPLAKGAGSGKHGLDRKKCHARCLEVGRYLNEQRGIDGMLDICGKCATGPCALRMPQRCAGVEGRQRYI